MKLRRTRPRSDSVSETETKAGTVKHNGCDGPVYGPARFPGRQATNQAIRNYGKRSLTHRTRQSPREPRLPGTGHELDAFLGKAFEETPVWVRLWESIRDVFFPVKLPPLQLTSKPIPVPDRMAVKANPWAIGISTTVNVIILLVVLFLVGRKIVEAVKPSLMATNIDVGDYKAPKDTTKAGGGGGGGDRSLIEANKGKLPKMEKDPITPPQPQTIEHPKLPEAAAINVQKEIQLPDNDMPVIGMHSSANVNVQSAGTGIWSRHGDRQRRRTGIRFRERVRARVMAAIQAGACTRSAAGSQRRLCCTA